MLTSGCLSLDSSAVVQCTARIAGVHNRVKTYYPMLCAFSLPSHSNVLLWLTVLSAENTVSCQREENVKPHLKGCAMASWWFAGCALQCWLSARSVCKPRKKSMTNSRRQFKALRSSWWYGGLPISVARRQMCRQWISSLSCDSADSV